jgi:hypothetical protein
MGNLMLNAEGNAFILGSGLLNDLCFCSFNFTFFFHYIYIKKERLIMQDIRSKIDKL